MTGSLWVTNPFFYWPVAGARNICQRPEFCQVSIMVKKISIFGIRNRYCIFPKTCYNYTCKEVI